MLNKINRKLDKLMPLITPSSIVLGILLADSLHSFSFLVPWIFAFMTFSGSLGSGFKEFVQVIRHPLPLVLVLLVLHIVMPLTAWISGDLIFHNDPFTITGMILAMSIPTGISSMIWVSIYKGHIPLTLSLILIDTFLSPFVVPYSLSLMVGSKVSMDVWGLMKGLLLMVVLPSLAGMLLNQFSSGKVKKWGPILSPFSKIGVILVISINGAVVAPYVFTLNWKFVAIVGTMLIISSVGYLLGWLICYMMNWKRDIMFSVIFNAGMRNTVAGVALAVSFFPAPVSVPVITGTIFQQLLASLFGYLVNRSYPGERSESFPQEKLHRAPYRVK